MMEKPFIVELTGNTVEGIKKILENKNEKLTENDEKVGNALLFLMTNWEELFAEMGSNKFNKSSILMFIKETTGMNTKEVRDSMKIYKKEYNNIKFNLINS